MKTKRNNLTRAKKANSVKGNSYHEPFIPVVAFSNKKMKKVKRAEIKRFRRTGKIRLAYKNIDEEYYEDQYSIQYGKTGAFKKGCNAITMDYLTKEFYFDEDCENQRQKYKLICK